MTIFIGLLGGVLGGIVGGFTTYFSTRSTMLLGLRQDYAKTLREIRLKGHQQLFHLSRQIPRHWLLTPEPSRAELLEVRTSFHDWYYGPDASGMFLSPDSKQSYIALMNALDAAMFEISSTGETKVRDRPDSKLSHEESHKLLELTSDLRHKLAADIGAGDPPGARSFLPALTVAPLGHVKDSTVSIADATG